MEELNLFGVPLAELEDYEGGEAESVKDRNRKREFVRELISIMEELDADRDADGIGLV